MAAHLRQVPARSLGSRRGGIVRPLLAVMTLLAMLGAGYFRYLVPVAKPWAAVSTHPVTATAEKGPFVHEVIERGEVESSSNIEVRCEVQSRNSLGTAILEIAPEGTYVEKGDFLVRLDDSTLKAELLQQQILCNNSSAQVIQAESDVESAKLSLSEYLNGTYKQEQETLESAAFQAEETLRRAEEQFQFTKRLTGKGYTTQTQFEADRFAVEKAKKDLDVARGKLEVLRTYTRQKMVRKFEADIRTAEAKTRSQQDSHRLDEHRLKHIEQQIARCEVRAPSAGQVLYANSGSSRSSSGEILIAEGRLVRERQVIIRLPDPKRMQVVTKVNESRIDLIRTGMVTKVKVDAIPDTILEGRVRSVAEYPIPPQSSLMAHIKEYAAVVEIAVPHEGLRSGMTAEVAIQVEQADEAIQVPVHAVLERDGKHYCLLQRDNEIEPREVKIGAANEKFVVIEDGVAEGEAVVLSPEKYEQFVELSPKSPPGELPGTEGKGTERIATGDRVPSVSRAATRSEKSNDGPAPVMPASVDSKPASPTSKSDTSVTTAAKSKPANADEPGGSKSDTTKPETTTTDNGKSGSTTVADASDASSTTNAGGESPHIGDPKERGAK